jgi:hypothetical protein
VRSYILN